MFNGITEESGGGNSLKGKQYVYPKRTIDNLHIGKSILDFGMDGDYYKDSRNHSGFYKSPEDRIRDAVKDYGVAYLESDIYENLDRRLDEHQENNPLNDKPADAVEEFLDENNKMAHADPQSPIQRNNQPMGTYMKIGWKDDDGNYTRSDSYNRALDSLDTGGAFKDALLEMDGDAKQDWLNNNHGGRGLGYMGQNAYQSNPNMAERRAAVQANARRIRGMS